MDERTTCVIAGGGPGGVVLGYLLARAGVAVTLLESRGDFDRRFRGDSLAPAVLDHLDRLGLAEPLLAEIPHVQASAFVWSTPEKRYVLADYRDTSAKFPFYALVPQARFLPWMVERAKSYGLDARMGARVTELLRDDEGRVVGVGYTQDGARHRLRADLVVGSDGRNSKVRQLSSLTATELNSSIDIAWIELPRRDGDPPLSGLELMSERGHNLAFLGQGGGWQVGFTIPSDTFGELREAGVEPLRAVQRRRAPWLGDRVDLLTDTNQLTLLPIRITKLDRWSEPGLLLIGDAAHVISPVGGNGINFAIVDAAEAANRLVGPLTAAPVDPAAVDAATAEVERVRRPRVDREQAFQVRVERSTGKRLATGRDLSPALPLRLMAAVPRLARWSARRSARALAVPAPDPRILAGSTPVR
ncbi:MAG TPA: FAD-dependent monooxygenase [Pseudonocardia sp.]|nr:FAD-dependent monooxygenase [Pseudonocardia sp.]